jgi:hypothetical protein
VVDRCFYTFTGGLSRTASEFIVLGSVVPCEFTASTRKDIARVALPVYSDKIAVCFVACCPLLVRTTGTRPKQ